MIFPCDKLINFFFYTIPTATESKYRFFKKIWKSVHCDVDSSQLFIFNGLKLSFLFIHLFIPIFFFILVYQLPEKDLKSYGKSLFKGTVNPKWKIL